MRVVITVGGLSRRMGRDKASLPLGGESFLTRLVRRYGEIGPVYISVRERGQGGGQLPELVDPWPGDGPMNALAAAFAGESAEPVFLSAVDLPFGTPALCRRLCALYEAGGTDACVIRRADGTAEPLFAVYGPACGAEARRLLAQGQRAFKALFACVRVRWVEENELAEFALPELLSNINTAQEYRAAQQREKGEHKMDPMMVRRSVRRFNDKPVEPEKTERLLRAAMQAPSGKNTRPWHFIVITDQETREAVSAMSEFSGMCRYAPLVILALADLSADSTEEWFAQNMACCVSNILHEAVLEGLGATYCGMYPRTERIRKAREYFGLPENIMPFALIPVGYTDKVYPVEDRYDPARVHYGKW